MARITLEDVAVTAGVSFKTVSRVLNNEPNVSDDTCKKVKQAISELNYVPNSAARNLPRTGSKTIGLVIDCPVNSPFSSIMIELTLKESMHFGYSLALFSKENVSSKKIVDAYLGHRAIDFVCYQSGLHQEGERDDGYHNAFIETGLPCNEDWLFGGSGRAFHLGLSGTFHLLSNNKELTAIFAETDEVAMGCVSAIWQLGLKIPEDISVISFDDISYASMIVPLLTTIHQPLDEFTRIAVEHHVGMIEGTATKPIDMIMPSSWWCAKPAGLPHWLEVS